MAAPDSMDVEYSTESVPGVRFAPFTPADLAELVVLQRCCWVPEAILNESLSLPALLETPEQVLAWATTQTTIMARLGARLVGGVRAQAVRTPDQSLWEIGRLMVAPDLAGRGLGQALLRLIEQQAPDDVRTFYLFTGARSERNQRIYQRAGYQIGPPPSDGPISRISGLVHLTKPRS